MSNRPAPPPFAQPPGPAARSSHASGANGQATTQPADFWQRLGADVQPDRIKVKQQATSKDRSKGMFVAYIDARDAAQHLDDVAGPQNWQDEYVPLPGSGDPSMLCHLSVRAPGSDEWITKCGTGTAGQNTDFKDAESDALKRALVKFGYGRDLYRLPKVWSQLDDRGRATKSESAIVTEMLRRAGR